MLDRMSMQADELVIAMLTAEETSERYDLLKTALEDHDDRGVQYLSRSSTPSAWQKLARWPRWDRPGDSHRLTRHACRHS